jgi:predicted transcriptional regulator
MRASQQNKLFTHVLSELRSEIIASKIKQSTIGEVLGLKQSAVSALLSGKSLLNMRQFLKLCDLLTLDPSLLLQKAARREQREIPMTPQIQAVLYKSETHVLLYSAATRELDPKEIKINNVSNESIREAFKELTQVGLLKEKKGRYIQKDPHIIYRAPTRLANSKLHQEIVVRSWKYFDRNIQDKIFLTDKFNYYQVDRFTSLQVQEIQNMMWKVYEKVAAFQDQNMLSNYSQKEEMLLWNVHVMMMLKE